MTGFLADRMSVNLELPTAEGLRKLAPGKTRDKILKPMRQIQRGIVNQMAREGLLEKKGIISVSSTHLRLATYAAKCVENEILMLFRAGKKPVSYTHLLPFFNGLLTIFFIMYFGMPDC